MKILALLLYSSAQSADTQKKRTGSLIDTSRFWVRQSKECGIPVLKCLAKKSIEEIFYAKEPVWAGQSDLSCSSATFYLEEGTPKLVLIKVVDEDGRRPTDYRYLDHGRWKACTQEEYTSRVDQIKNALNIWDIKSSDIEEPISVQLGSRGRQMSDQDVESTEMDASDESAEPGSTRPLYPGTLDIFRKPYETRVNVRSYVYKNTNCKEFKPKIGQDITSVVDGLCDIWNAEPITKFLEGTLYTKFSHNPLFRLNFEKSNGHSKELYFEKINRTWREIDDKDYNRKNRTMLSS
ncbi:signal peptide-containing protein [Theileria equi strain WA]|uniref:Signal peptide-containing protein n=1 Tax=Theileria equi strain WA TaxID=1537102 RepID=L0AWH2_THEEQ|nr:signal peptide-containing protein [Theileria equi strain WA]AFZ79932.1 signal peptide-containing protein [Theileria equi strain WA]|eukprot:XP_004829598.1 signal peptide-containing protein [Theileria equi strain WA]